MPTRPLLCLAAIGLALAGWPATLTYTVKTPGRVSVGIYGAKGRLLRTLQSGKQTAAGAQHLNRDGKDDAGKLLPDGAYSYQGLSANIDRADRSSRPLTHHRGS